MLHKMDQKEDVRPLKAILLAAGTVDVFQQLGDKRIIDYVLAMTSRFVPVEDTFIVVKEDRYGNELLFNPAVNRVVQAEKRGTGHAVLQTAESLMGYEGDLLILYADTPLFRPDSILGLINRHRLLKADLTLFTAVSNEKKPYGRIIRNKRGEIIEIIEDEQASDEVKTIPELNVGAYVAGAELLFPILKQLSTQVEKGESIPLTDIVHQLIQSGKKITSFCSYDPDEILGINNPKDLADAEFILQKRYFRPERPEEDNEIRFGTGGWRAIIGEGFTMPNVRRLCQALSNLIIRRQEEQKGVVIGYDRRFLSKKSAEVAAEVFAGNNIRVILLPEDAPTPLITYATEKARSAFGLAFTASHNPPEWNGLKVFHGDGSLLMTDETNLIEIETNQLSSNDIVKIEIDLALTAGIVKYKDFSNAYIDAVEEQINMKTIRKAGLHVAIDPMYGVGQATLGTILTEARCRVTAIHSRHDPLFGGRSPAPNLTAMRQLITTVKDGKFDIGLAMDGDADRIAIVDERGNYIHINDVLLLLFYYLRGKRGLSGGVVRNLATTHLLDRLAGYFGERAIETPVGFKHIIAGMQASNALLGGESSGGLTIRGHILGKDGILAAGLIVEMIACSEKTLSDILEEIYTITGRLFSIEESIPATSEMKIVIPKKLKMLNLETINGLKVIKISHLDGTKIFLEKDQWVLLRFSGTEPVLRIFAEAETEEKTEGLILWGKEQLI